MPNALTGAQLAQLRTKLDNELQALHGQLLDNQAEMPPPSRDEGTVARREVQQRLNDADQVEVKRVQEALHAMSDGTYGLCERCGKHIPFERLVVEPMTLHCVACKAALEQAALRPH